MKTSIEKALELARKAKVKISSSAKEYKYEYDGKVSGFESTWNKGIGGKYEGKPVIYFVTESDDYFFAILSGILVNGEIVNASEAFDDLFKSKEEALGFAKKLATDEHFLAEEEYANGGEIKSGLRRKYGDAIDSVKMGVPLMIRLFEYSKEDAKTDVQLHEVAERAIALSKEKEVLTMKDYDYLVGIEGKNTFAKGGSVQISNQLARQIANEWHGGQWSALYQFASSGVYLIENHLRYLKEVQEALEPEFYLYPTTLSKRNQASLNSLKRWFEYKGLENGIKTEWSKHSVYGYMIPHVSKDTPDEIANKATPLKLMMAKGGELGGVRFDSFEVTAPAEREKELKAFMKMRDVKDYDVKKEGKNVTYSFKMSDVGAADQFKGMSMKYGFKFAKGGELGGSARNYLGDLWFAVFEGRKEEYERLAKALDKENVSYRIQNEVAENAIKEREMGRKAIDTFEVQERIKNILNDKFAKGGKIESKVERKVKEVNELIASAIDSDGDPISVIDSSSTWQAPMRYKPIKYSNGVLYLEWSTWTGSKDEISKEKILKKDIEFDGIPALNEIAKMYRNAIKKDANKKPEEDQYKSGGGVKNEYYHIVKHEGKYSVVHSVFKDINLGGQILESGFESKSGAENWIKKMWANAIIVHDNITEYAKGGDVGKLCPVRTKIQTIMFDKTKFSKGKAKKWARQHEYKDRVDETDNYYRMRQIKPERFKGESFRTIEFTEGIKAVVGCPKRK